jgi:hypothetical protein
MTSEKWIEHVKQREILGVRCSGKDAPVKRRTVSVPKMRKQELLGAFERMCKALGKTSRGFDHKNNGRDEWSMRYQPGHGWMVVSGIGGCGASLSRWNGYMQTRWNFLMMMEAVNHACSAIQHTRVAT